MTIIKPREAIDWTYPNNSLARHRANRKAREKRFKRAQARRAFINDLMQPEMLFLLVTMTMVIMLGVSQFLADLRAL